LGFWIAGWVFGFAIANLQLPILRLPISDCRFPIADLKFEII
jgi:hypothetical protein